jgi:hypothetical protein
MKFPTSAACEIAGISRQRFNEDVASGAYACAPVARSRVGRYFDEVDVCGLFVYSFLLRVWNAQADSSRSPISKKIASMYACKVMEAMRADTEGASRIDFPLSGFNDDWTARQEDQAPAFWVPVAGVKVTEIGSMVATICFSLDGILSAVRERVERWQGE